MANILTARKQRLSEYLFAFSQDPEASEILPAVASQILSERKAPNLRTAVFEHLIARIEHAAAEHDFEMACRCAGVADHYFGETQKRAQFFLERGPFPKLSKKAKQLGETLHPIAFQATDEKASSHQSAYLVLKALSLFSGTQVQKERLLNLAGDVANNAAAQELSHPNDFAVIAELLAITACHMRASSAQGEPVHRHEFVNKEFAETSIALAKKARQNGYYQTAQDFLGLAEDFVPCLPGDWWESLASENTSLSEDLASAPVDSNGTLLQELRLQTEALREKTKNLSMV